jgi:hypothetical protein
MDLGPFGSELEQTAGVEEPACLLLGIEHAVAVDREDALHQMNDFAIGNRA